MRSLDETDLAILRLLVEDARRPYSDIAERVDVSAPTVSDRIDRLEELGVIQQFTVDVDRSKFTDGLEVLVDVEVSADAGKRVVEQLVAAEEVEHAFLTADARVIATVTVPQDGVRSLLADAVELEVVESYRVHLLEDRRWQPSIDDAELSLSCDECGNAVTSDGVSARIDGELHHFCCPTCRTTYEERYVELKESI